MKHICEVLEISLNIYSNANLRTNMSFCRMYKHDESYNTYSSSGKYFNYTCFKQYLFIYLIWSMPKPSEILG